MDTSQDYPVGAGQAINKTWQDLKSAEAEDHAASDLPGQGLDALLDDPWSASGDVPFVPEDPAEDPDLADDPLDDFGDDADAGEIDVEPEVGDHRQGHARQGDVMTDDPDAVSTPV